MAQTFVTTMCMNLRDAPDPDAAVCGKLRSGATFEVVSGVVPTRDSQRGWMWLPVSATSPQAWICYGHGVRVAATEDTCAPDTTMALACRRPYLSRTSGRFRFGWKLTHASGGPFSVEVRVPFTPELEVVGYVPSPPDSVHCDAYGNRVGVWSFCGLRRSLTVGIECRVDQATVVYDLQRGVGVGDYPIAPELRALYTAPTACFDYGDPGLTAAAQALRERCAGRDLVETLAELYVAVNRRLTETGATGKQSQASYYYKSGIGRCYAHVLVLVALARALGVPARASGGFCCAPAELGGDFVHTWAQVYVPARACGDGGGGGGGGGSDGSGQGGNGTGTADPGSVSGSSREYTPMWVDLDSQLDGTGQQSTITRFDAFAVRPSRAVAHFRGSYDALPGGSGRCARSGDCVTQRTWTGCVSWQADDPTNAADVVTTCAWVERAAIPPPPPEGFVGICPPPAGWVGLFKDGGWAHAPA